MWTNINGWDNYEISKSGNVRNIRTKRNLSLHPNGSGYKRAQLCNKGLMKQITVHRLMWLNFVGEIPEGRVIDHIDNNRLNNRLDNLQLLTQGQNIKKGKDIKTTKKSFSKEQKRVIQNQINLGVSSREISRKFDISWQWESVVRKSGQWEEFGDNIKNL